MSFFVLYHSPTEARLGRANAIFSAVDQAIKAAIRYGAKDFRVKFNETEVQIFSADGTLLINSQPAEVKRYIPVERRPENKAPEVKADREAWPRRGRPPANGWWSGSQVIEVATPILKGNVAEGLVYVTAEGNVIGGVDLGLFQRLYLMNNNKSSTGPKVFTHFSFAELAMIKHKPPEGSAYALMGSVTYSEDRAIAYLSAKWRKIL
jgi:hypothetical protein